MTDGNNGVLVPFDKDVVFEGWLSKRGNRYKGWNDRYFVLRGNVLSYYVQRGDVQPKGTYYLSEINCKVSDIYLHDKQKDIVYCIKIKFSKKGFASDTANDSASVGGESVCSSKSLKSPKPKQPLSPSKLNEDIPATIVGESKRKSHTTSTPTTLNKAASPFRTSSQSQPPPSPPDEPSLEKQDGLQKHVKELNEQERLKEQGIMRSLYLENKEAKKVKRKKRIVTGTKIAAAGGAAVAAGVFTAGIGLAAGMVVLGIGAAAGGTAVTAEAATSTYKNQKGKVVLEIATNDFEAIKQWKAALDACLAFESEEESKWDFFSTEEEKGLMKSRSQDESVLSSSRPPSTQWVPMEGGWATFLGTGVHSLRIFREEKVPEQFSQRLRRTLQRTSEDRPSPPLKCQLVLNTSALNALLCLMSHNRFPDSSDFTTPNSGQRASFRIIETIDDHSDVIHLVFRPLYLFPSWTKPRDFVLFRLWWLQDDGSYIVCYDSIQHRECPPFPCNVRGTLNGFYTISPPKKDHKKAGDSHSAMNRQNECLLSALVQVDPKGWVPTFNLPPFVNQGYAEAFGVAALLQILDIRDALDQDRFITNDQGPLKEKLRIRDVALSHVASTDQAADSPILIVPSMDSLEEDLENNYDFSYSQREYHQEALDELECGFASNPPQLPVELWAQPDANSFMVRGKTYINDKVKIHAGDSVFRLISVDTVRVENNFFTGFCTHPTERMQRALERERKQIEDGIESDLPPYFFVVNICIPGFHMVFYYAIDDMGKINGTNGKPESKLANEFFFGESDEMRDATFKMIPQIIEGNFVVRKAVGSTPAIMGTKVRQLYVRGDRFFEVILDTGSSSVAAGVVKLSLGYAKTLVVDMGFLLEGTDETTLPEKMLGCVRMKNVDFGPHMRFVEPPLDSVS